MGGETVAGAARPARPEVLGERTASRGFVRLGIRFNFLAGNYHEGDIMTGLEVSFNYVSGIKDIHGGCA